MSHHRDQLKVHPMTFSSPFLTAALDPRARGRGGPVVVLKARHAAGAAGAVEGAETFRGRQPMPNAWTPRRQPKAMQTVSKAIEIDQLQPNRAPGGGIPALLCVVFEKWAMGRKRESRRLP